MKLVTSTTTAFLFILLFGCTKTDSLTKQVNPDIESAKAWLLSHNNSGSVVLSQTNNSTGIKKLSNKFEAIWKDALVHDDGNYIVIEAPAKFDKDIVLQNGSTINEDGNKNGVVRLIVVKSKENGSINGYFMVFKADNIVNKQDYKDLELNNYKIKKPNFDGTVTFFSLDWAFVNGWRFTDGLISGLVTNVKYFDGSDNGENEILSNVLPPEGGGGCITKTTTWYIQTCINYSDGSSVCSGWEYLYSTTETVCNGTGGSGGVSNQTTEIVWDAEMEAFFQDYKKYMTPRELEIFYSMSVIKRAMYLDNARIAIHFAKLLYPASTQDGGIGDAFRHALFSALNAKDLKESLARSLGQAHEIGTTSPAPNVTMDLINNETGYGVYKWAVQQVGANGHFLREVIAMRVRQLADSGQLVTNTPINLVE